MILPAAKVNRPNIDEVRMEKLKKLQRKIWKNKKDFEKERLAFIKRLQTDLNVVKKDKWIE